ncbi:MAG: ATP-binding cassette domain-containing protein [Bacteroidaceae bacterium]
MQNITLHQLLPNVFRGRTDIQSDLWQKDLVLERGRLYLVEAQSGKGKSSFCSFLTGYRNDYAGRILFDTTDTQQLSVAQWSRLRTCSISTVFQELRLFPELTALENVLIKNQLTRYKSVSQIRQWFDALGIGDKLNAPVAQMSYGQQQRVAMIRALVQPMDFLLLDEPVSHLDDENASIMAETMMQEVRSQGAAVVVTSIGKHMLLPYNQTIRL